MPNTPLLPEILDIAKKARSIQPNDEPLMGTLTGVLLCLYKAIDYKYNHAHAPADTPVFAGILQQLDPIATRPNKIVNPKFKSWLAGFYFNSALHRLAALIDRVSDKYQYLKSETTSKKLIEENGEVLHPFLRIRHDVNDAKHTHSGLHHPNKEPLMGWKDGQHWTSGDRGKRRTRPEDAIRAIGILTDILVATRREDRIYVVVNSNAPSGGESRSSTVPSGI